MRHQLAGKNLALVCLRQARRREEGTFFVSQNLINKDAVSLFDIGTVFPLFLYDETFAFDTGQKEIGFAHGQSKRPNLAQSFLKTVAVVLQLPQKGAHNLPAGLTPEDIFHYTYAVLHSPGYRSRYAEFLKIDFPRLPLTGNLELFRALARLGGELTALHLLEFKVAQASSLCSKDDHRQDAGATFQPITGFVWGSARVPRAGSGVAPDSCSTNISAGKKSDERSLRPDAEDCTRDAGGPLVEKISWSHDTVWVDKAQTTGFQGVRENVWNFHIGGYQVCAKWLKDRKGRTLTKDDLAHYQKIIVALSETIRLMAKIDQVIEGRGGWPGAFQPSAT